MRSIPKPDTINEILSEVGIFASFVSEDKHCVCNKCYQFCIQLVEEYSEMHADEHILEALKVKRDELQSMISECNEPNELALLHTAVYLGEFLLNDSPSIYTYYYEYIKSTRTSVDLWPKYKVFIYILKEFSNLVTSSLPCKKYGRILYRTNCDPFLMLAQPILLAVKRWK